MGVVSILWLGFRVATLAAKMDLSGEGGRIEVDDPGSDLCWDVNWWQKESFRGVDSARGPIGWIVSARDIARVD